MPSMSRLVHYLRTSDQIALDWLWRLSRDHSALMKPTWPVPPELLQRLQVLWPTTYEWPPAYAWMINLLAGLRRHVRVEPTDIPQPYQGIVLVQFLSDGQPHDVIIDYSDYLDYINADALDRAVVYFKMQFREGGYGEDRIIPGGYPTFSKHLYKYITKLRSVQDRAPPVFDVYGRFGLSFATEVRTKAVGLLSAQSRFGYEGGTKTVRYGQFLREVARAKIGIDLPGNGDFTFRLVDYLALGVCIIGPPHRTAFPVPLVDREQIIHCAPDLSDLVPLCQQYLEDDEARTRVAHNAREYFDRFLHRDQLSLYYLQQFLQK
jgi:Glycosyl transferases group 1